MFPCAKAPKLKRVYTEDPGFETLAHIPAIMIHTIRGFLRLLHEDAGVEHILSLLSHIFQFIIHNSIYMQRCFTD
jgi:Ni,Fe-hydrogenase I cytochrome b subunit